MLFTNIKNRFSTLDKRSAIVIKNSMATALMKVAVLLCSLVMVPITLNYLNAENYGIWMAMTSILYWFAFFDVGLGNGMRNYLSEAISRQDYIKARSYFSTAIFLLAIIAVLIGILSIIIIFQLDLNHIFNTHIMSNKSLAYIMVVAISFSLIQFVAKNVGMVYIAMQRYAINDFIVFIGQLISTIIVYIITKTTESHLIYIVIAITSIPALVFILASIPLLKQHPQLKPSIKSIDFASAKKIIGKGLGFFIIQITSCLVIFGSANILISHYCGPEQVTVYNISYKLFNILIIIYTIIISPLWNAYTDASVKNDYAWIRKIFKKSIYLWAASLLLGLLMLLISGWFFKKWVGNSVDIPLGVSISILIYVCMFNFNNCVTYLINGLNKIKIQIITSILGTIIYLIAVCFFIKGTYGIYGISISMCVIYTLMSLVHLYQCNLLAKNKAHGIWNE
ncbi:MAG: oligosaccharide flippase family protein [Paraprevotella sp.]|nr:oligosaccharide flippase family protein [Paraprevotella sp.]